MMPTEREMRTQQENTLFEFLLITEFIGAGKTKALDEHMIMMVERSKSGMTAEEIDAVKERVSKVFKNFTL